MTRTPLVLLPDGSLVRTADVPPEGIIVTEPPLAEAPAQSVIDQTAAVLGVEPKPVRALFDVEGTD
jgi:hypothetical protein